MYEYTVALCICMHTHVLIRLSDHPVDNNCVVASADLEVYMYMQVSCLGHLYDL